MRDKQRNQGGFTTNFETMRYLPTLFKHFNSFSIMFANRRKPRFWTRVIKRSHIPKNWICSSYSWYSHFLFSCFVLGFSSKIYKTLAKGICTAFLNTFTTMYTKYANLSRTHQGSSFTSDSWIQIANLTGNQSRLPEVRIHISLEIRERLYSRFRRIYRKIRFTHPELLK